MSTQSARLYETDFYGWIQQQAHVLKAGNFASLDLENLIEEIESMGKSHQRALESRLEILLMHLLKWQLQPERITPSRQYTIRAQRKRIADHLKKKPQPDIATARSIRERVQLRHDGRCRGNRHRRIHLPDAMSLDG